MRQNTAEAEAEPQGAALGAGEDPEEWRGLFVAIFNLGAFVHYPCRQNWGFVPPIGHHWAVEKPKGFRWRFGRLQISVKNIC